MGTGWSQSGPWRLATEISSPCPDGRRCRRSGAALGCCSVAAGRIRKNSAAPLRAARCSRRNAVEGARAIQHRSIAWSSCRRTCSAAHRASLAERGAIQSSLRQSRRQLMQQWIQGSPGGCTSMMRRCGRLAKAGRSRLISPMPGWSQASSVRVPSGQPRPGNSWSSPEKPVETVAWRGACRLAARQSAGCMHSGCGGEGDLPVFMSGPGVTWQLYCT